MNAHMSICAPESGNLQNVTRSTQHFRDPHLAFAIFFFIYFEKTEELGPNGWEHGTLVFYLTSLGFQRAWNPWLYYTMRILPVLLFGDDFVIYQLPREVWESSRLLYLMPRLPHGLCVQTAFFLSWRRLFSTFACDLPTPDPTGVPDSHLLGSEPNPIRDPWPTSLQFHQPTKKEALCIFPTVTPLTLPHLVPLTLSSGWHPWIDSCRTRKWRV